MNQRVTDFLLGVTVMTLLWAGVSYTNAGYRCLNDRGGVWVGPVARCYAIDQFMPAGALEAAK